MSQAVSTYTPVGHRPAAYWEEVMGRKDIPVSAPESLGYTDPWLQRLFGGARGELLGCWVSGGRYWEAKFRIPELLPRLSSTRRTLFVERLLRLLPKVDLETGAGAVPPEMRFSICAPAQCQQQELLEEVAPRFLSHHVFEKLRGFEGVNLSTAIDAEEMVDWTGINLDFAIIGVFNCGTTSLNRNLDQHPEIVFSSEGEDLFFAAEVIHRLLPLKSQVDGFNRVMEAAAEKKFQVTGQRPRLRGVYNPTLFSMGLARMALASIEDLRVLLVLCDPLKHMERRFLEHHYCHQDPAWAFEQELSRNRPEDSCFPSAEALLRPEPSLQYLWTNLDLLSVWKRFSQAKLLDQEALSSAATYQSIARFLGVAPFGPGQRFQRYNTMGKYRTDLCRNASLVRRLHRRLKHAFDVQEQLFRLAGEPVPERLRTHQPHCARVANAVFCPIHKPCADERLTRGFES
ncbi:unnamed protein product [Effrenium voratum]|nr:unnamed protein product [Effrenium voratum]